MSNENQKSYMKSYYEKNKDKWSKYNTERIFCEACNKTIRKQRKNIHEKTKMHQLNQQLLNFKK